MVIISSDLFRTLEIARIITEEAGETVDFYDKTIIGQKNEQKARKHICYTNQNSESG